MVGTLLHTAVREGKIEEITELIRQGEDLDTYDAFGNTPLHCAVECINLDALKLLLDAGANTRFLNSRRESPLQRAIKSENVEIIRLLLNKRGANTRDWNGSYPLHTAVECASSKIVKVIIECGAKLDVTDRRQICPLHLAVDLDDLESVRVLVESRADLNARDGLGNTPLFKAASKSGNMDILKLLLRAGADLDARCEFQETPLHQASAFGRLETVKLLLDAGAEVDAKCSRGYTPLFKAIRAMPRNVMEILKILLDFGANVEGRGKLSENTFFVQLIGSYMWGNHFVDQVVRLDMIKLLMEYAEIDWINRMAGSLIDFMGNHDNYEKSIIFIQAIGQLMALEFEVESKLVNYIANCNIPSIREYFFECRAELEMAKNTKLRNCWLSYFHLLTDNKSKLVRYAGNENVIKDFETDSKFPIYGATIKNRLMDAVNCRNAYDVAAVNLRKNLPIDNPPYLVVKTIIENLDVRDWRKLSDIHCA